MGFKEENHKIEVYLDAEEMKILKKLSAKDNTSYAETLRLALIWDAFSQGNLDAAKLVSKRTAGKIRKKVQGLGETFGVDFSKA